MKRCKIFFVASCILSIASVLWAANNSIEDLKNKKMALALVSVEDQAIVDDKAVALKKMSLRHTAIREAGITIALQTAVKKRYAEINKELESIDSELNQIYNFSLLVEYDGKVLPPVIAEAHNALQIKTANESVYSQVVYKILQPARIIPVPPNWRHYLIKNYTAIEDVNEILLPHGDSEQAVWEAAIDKGWTMGIKQADRVFLANLARLDRDYKGLLTYKMLAQQGIVSVPMVAEGEYGIKIGDKTLDVDQRIFRITNESGFNKVDKWKPIGHIQKNQ